MECFQILLTQTNWTPVSTCKK